ncbi:hypothetical protein NPIL_546181 [Nephila pilipes]|uniref:Uncharacterized protein n=1 Tax=Nephila pilipes TaxID=299642 RepID=A0A8X6N6W1_NEPPI|nr:hypothetical protein NPIL_546181 [Nephila pilipes]
MKDLVGRHLNLSTSDPRDTQKVNGGEDRAHAVGFSHSKNILLLTSSSKLFIFMRGGNESETPLPSSVPVIVYGMSMLSTAVMRRRRYWKKTGPHERMDRFVFRGKPLLST